MQNQINNFKNFIGIAQKAGKIKSGDNMVIEALNKQEARLVIIAGDAADSIKQELYKYNKSNVPVITFADKITLGEIIGKSPRGMLAVCDDGFAAAMIAKYDSLN